MLITEMDEISDVVGSEWTAPDLALPVATSAIPWYLRPSMSMTNRFRRSEPQKPKLEKGIFGCQKRCLYAMLIMATAAAVINLSLLIWIIKVLDMNPGGLGKLRVVDGGLRFYGEVEFDEFLSGEKIRPKEHLRVESSRKLSVTSKRWNRTRNSITLGGANGVEFTNRYFKVYNRRKKCVFETGRSFVGYNVSGLILKGEGGTELNGSLVSDLITSPGNLHFESPLRRVHVEGPEGVEMNSKAGEIRTTFVDMVHLQAKKGTITLDGKEFFLQGLQQQRGDEQGSSDRTFDVCVCSNGRIFLTPPASSCQAGDWVCED